MISAFCEGLEKAGYGVTVYSPGYCLARIKKCLESRMLSCPQNNFMCLKEAFAFFDIKRYNIYIYIYI